jgi:GNAT superfamily N-acetyltransferase
MTRRVMRLPLDRDLPPSRELLLDVRHPAPDDTEELARLMLDAFVDTIDYDPGDDIDTARRQVAMTFAGDYGVLLTDASFIALDGNEALSASIITRYMGAPFVAFSMTRSDRKGRGLAGALLVKSVRALAEAGEHHIDLEVTVGNEPADHLYRSLGFEVVEVLDD